MTKPRRTPIVFVNSFPAPGLGGGEVQLLSVVEACLEAKMRVTVVCARGSGLVSALEDSGADTIEMDFTLPSVLVSLYRLRSLIANRTRDRRTMILQGTGFLTNLLTRMAAAGRPEVRVVNAVHVEPGASLHDGGSRIGFRFRVLLERMTGQRVDRFLAVSDAVARKMEEVLGFDRRRIVVVRNGVDLTALHEHAEHTLPAATKGPPWDADEASPWIGVVGRLEAVKGIEVFLRAVHVLARGKGPMRLPGGVPPPDPTFVIAGTGALEASLRTLAQQLGLDEPRNQRSPAGGPPEIERKEPASERTSRGSGQYRVHFLGHVRPVAPLYRKLRALVIPSFSEGFPMAALEAMALGVPVVATSVGGIPEAVEDGVTGWLVPSGDAEALAAALREALQDPEEAMRRGENGRRRVEEGFTIDGMKRSYQAFYAALVPSPLSVPTDPPVAEPMGGVRSD